MKGFLCVAFALIVATLPSCAEVRSPTAGEVYREYTIATDTSTWRVTDPATPNAEGATHLPNLVYQFVIDDLANLDDVLSADFIVAAWSGHIGTTDLKIKLNEGTYAPLTNHPSPTACVDVSCDPGREGYECYLSNWNPGVVIDVADLKIGTNTVTVSSGPQDCYAFGNNWGQWGFWGAVVRLKLDAAEVVQPVATITSPGTSSTISDNPTIIISTADTLDRVEVFAYYDGPDFDGDGDTVEYHQTYQRLKYGTEFQSTNHVGTLTEPPWQLVWDTTWVPDQAAGSIKLIARIRDATTGIWAVTPEVTGLTLDRPSHSVLMLPPQNVPEKFVARTGRSLQTSQVTMPSSVNLSSITAARLLISTYNGNDAGASVGEGHYIAINGFELPLGYGASFYIDYDWIAVEPEYLQKGVMNVGIYSESSNHGIEALWPGPTLLISTELSQMPVGPGLVGFDVGRVNGGDLPVRFTNPTNGFIDTRAKRALTGRNHDQINFAGGNHQVWGCNSGETDINRKAWCNSHGNSLFASGSTHWNRAGRCAGDLREPCWKPGIAGSEGFPSDRCLELGLGQCDTSYWFDYIHSQRDFWARDIHGHRVPVYGSTKNSELCNYEAGSGYCVNGPYQGEGCSLDDDCGQNLNTGTCSGMCSSGSSNAGAFCISDGACSGGTCVDAEALDDRAVTMELGAKSSCTNPDGSECMSGYCDFDAYTCGGAANAGAWIQSPNSHPHDGTPMNYTGNEAKSNKQECFWTYNLESDSPFIPFYADLVADVVEPWDGEAPTGGGLFQRGNELGGPASARTPEGGGIVMQFTDNSSPLGLNGYVPWGWPFSRKCRINTGTVCTNNASCQSANPLDTCSEQNNFKGSSVPKRSAYDHTKNITWAESSWQNLWHFSELSLAAHESNGLSGRAGVDMTNTGMTCETWDGFAGKRCKHWTENTGFYCETDLDCQRVIWDVALREAGGGKFCSKSQKPCPVGNECLAEDGSCLRLEPVDNTSMESGSVQRGVSCYDATSGNGCPDSNWLRGQRDGDLDPWDNSPVEQARRKLDFWWEYSQATDFSGGGEPDRQIHTDPVTNTGQDTPHGRGVASDVSNRYGIGWTYLYSIAQKNQAFYSPWDMTVTASGVGFGNECAYCREANYPTPSCTGPKTCNTETLFEDIYPQLFRSLGCATGPGVDTWKKYGVAPSGVYYREFAKGFVACNMQCVEGAGGYCDNSINPQLNVVLPAAPEGMWCTDLAGVERTGGQDYDCNGTKGGNDNVVQDYDGGLAGGTGFTGTQTLNSRTCIILYDEGSTQPDCDLLPEYSFATGAAPVVDPGPQAKGVSAMGVTIGN